jgi:hypothetical protein
VARVLPRDWDATRLLRFLTGLAMLALAFTAAFTTHLSGPTAVASEPVTPARVAVAQTVERAEVTSEPVAEAVPLPPSTVAPMLAGLVGFLLTGFALTGFAPSARPTRAPPAA